MCGHSSKRGSINSQISSCWIEYQICVCCYNELIRIGVITDEIARSRLCSRLLEKELNGWAEGIDQT